MILSMTAFARVERATDWGTFQWEIRTVNNRYLEISPRLPEELRVLEPAVRERVQGALGRGKADCTLRVHQGADNASRLTLDTKLATQLATLCREVDGLLERSNGVSAVDILRWPGVVSAPVIALDDMTPSILEGLDLALGDIVEGRQREGQKITALIDTRLDEMVGLIAIVKTRLPEILNAHKVRLTHRLADLREQLDQERIEQEMVMLAQKIDVAEELDRLELHITEVRRALQQPKPVGRRLDFLAQELNREANTLGSKSTDAQTTQVAVDLKVLIEQIREQVQNIE